MKTLRIPSLVAVLFLSATVSAQVSEAKLQQQEAKVRAFLARDKPYKALSLCNARLGAPPVDRFLPLRAEAYNRLGEHQKARQDARAWLDKAPDDREGLFQLALAEQGIGHGDSAIMLLDRLADGGGAPNVRYQLALAYQQVGRCGDALAQVRSVPADTATDFLAKVHRLRGECSAEEGDTASARRELDRAVELAPRDPVVYNSRGFFVHARNDHHAAAIADYDRAIKLNPNYSYAFNNRGWSRYKIGDTPGALRDMNKAAKRKVFNPYIYRNLGLVALGSGDTTGACTRFRQALEYGFTAKHGTEVEELIKANCKDAPPVQAPSAPMNAPDRPAVRSNAP